MFSDFMGTGGNVEASQASVPIVIDQAYVGSLFIPESHQMTAKMLDGGYGKPFGADLALVTLSGVEAHVLAS